MTETLRQYLAGGGRLNFDVHRGLIDAMRSPMSTDQRADRAAVARYEADTLGDGGDPRPGRHLTSGQLVEVAQATRFLADYLEGQSDPELDEMIQAALPAPLAVHLEGQTLPHRMQVGAPSGGYWSCDNCGATFETHEAKALLITDRPGYSSLHRDIVICGGCVAEAAASLRDQPSDRSADG